MPHDAASERAAAEAANEAYYAQKQLEAQKRNGRSRRARSQTAKRIVTAKQQPVRKEPGMT